MSKLLTVVASMVSLYLLCANHDLSVRENVARQFVNIKCSVSSARVCHTSVVNEVSANTFVLKKLSKNCRKRRYAPSCYVLSKHLEKAKPLRSAYYLNLACSLGDKDICHYAGQKFFHQWRVEGEQKSVLSKAPKYLSMGYEALKKGCSLGKKESCTLYNNYWANFHLRTQYVEYSCTNNKKDACKNYSELKKNKTYAKTVLSKYYSLKAYEFNSVRCNLTAYKKAPTKNRSLASVAKQKAEIYFDIKERTTNVILLGNPSETHDFKPRLQGEIVNYALSWITQGPTHYYPYLYYASQKGPWFYFQNADQTGRYQNIAYHQNTGQHFNAFYRGNMKQNISYKKQGDLYYPEEISLTNSNGKETKYIMSWDIQEVTKTSWPHTIRVYEKDNNYPATKYVFKNCMFKKNGQSITTSY